MMAVDPELLTENLFYGKVMADTPMPMPIVEQPKRDSLGKYFIFNVQFNYGVFT